MKRSLFMMFLYLNDAEKALYRQLIAVSEMLGKASTTYLWWRRKNTVIMTRWSTWSATCSSSLSRQMTACILPSWLDVCEWQRKVFSNRESGKDYADIVVEIVPEKIGIAIKLKYPADGDLDAGCREALEQIDTKNCTAQPKLDGMKRIIKCGIACHVKECKVAFARDWALYQHRVMIQIYLPYKFPI